MSTDKTKQESEQELDSLSSLPLDVILHIAKYLPLPAVKQLSEVNRPLHDALLNVFYEIEKTFLKWRIAVWHDNPVLPIIGQVVQVATTTHENVATLSLTHEHAAAITLDHQLLIFGRNKSNQCGITNVSYIRPSARIELPNNDIPKKVVVAEDRTFVLAESGNLYWCGKTENPLEKGITKFSSYQSRRVKDIAIGKNFTIIILPNGEVLSRGCAINGRLGYRAISSLCEGRKVPDLPSMSQVAVGYRHSVLLSSQGKVFVTGGNDHGQLGVGDNKHRERFTEIHELPQIVSIRAGENYTLCCDQQGDWYFAGDISTLQPQGTDLVTSSQTFVKLTIKPQDYKSISLLNTLSA